MNHCLPHWIIIQHLDQCLQLVLFCPACFFTHRSGGIGITAGSDGTGSSVWVGASFRSCGTSDGEVDIGVFEIDPGRNG